MKRLTAAATLLALLISLSGCIVVPVNREEVHHHYHDGVPEGSVAADAPENCAPLECTAPPE